VNGDEAWMGVQAMAALHHNPAFRWHTPSGNPLNLFLFVPELVLHAIARPSFGLLRLPAALSGIAALPVAFWFCRRAFGHRTAWIFTVLLAVLPINIAYSRFAWDACQTLLATTCAIFPALIAVKEPGRRVRWLLWSAMGFAAALLVHPTNIFIAPVLVVATVLSGRSELRDWWRRLDVGGKSAVLVFVLIFLASVGFGVRWLTPHSPRSAARIQTIRDNASSATHAAAFASYFLRLFSGVTIYQYVAGSCADQQSLETLAASRAEPYATTLATQPDPVGQWLHTVPMVELFLLASIAFLHRVRRERSAVDTAMLTGWALMVLSFYLVAGVGALMPHFERYAICLVTPTALMLARGSEWLTLGAARSARLALTGFLTVAWLWLGSFYTNYFAFIERTGNESHMTFRAASVEPKEAALRFIQSHRKPGETAWIVGLEWWSTYPLTYLSSSDPELRVPLDSAAFVLTTEKIQQPGLPELSAALRERRVWCVEFLESRHYPTLKRWLAAQTGEPIQETIIRDFADRPLLSIMQATTMEAQGLSNSN